MQTDEDWEQLQADMALAEHRHWAFLFNEQDKMHQAERRMVAAVAMVAGYALAHALHWLLPTAGW